MPYYVTDIADNMGVIISFKEGKMRVKEGCKEFSMFRHHGEHLEFL